MSYYRHRSLVITLFPPIRRHNSVKAKHLTTKLTQSTQYVNRWMGEKYDGVRFCWHPRLHTVYPTPSSTPPPSSPPLPPHPILLHHSQAIGLIFVPYLHDMYDIYSRQAKPLTVPSVYMSILPQEVFIDGELWYV